MALAPLLLVFAGGPGVQADDPATNGNWSLAGSSTLSGNSGGVNVRALGFVSASFVVTGGVVQGQGQLTLGATMNGGASNCHSDSPQVPFSVGGSADSGMFHLAMLGSTTSTTLTMTCDDGSVMPMQLSVASQTVNYDIAAVDGTTVDSDSADGGALPFLTIPAGFTGHSHVVVTQTR
ncbi:MAG: hypothetical protein JO247_05080 [Chloroflexi bacterium]|nr:hypothetical protein [Chloroflexota bacterium]